MKIAQREDKEKGEEKSHNLDKILEIDSDDVSTIELLGIQNFDFFTASKVVPQKHKKLLQQFHEILGAKIKSAEDQVVSLEDKLHW